MTETLNFKKKELRGDLATGIINFYQNEKKAWDELDNASQDELIIRANDFAKQAINEVVEILAADDRAVIQASVEQVVVKDGIKAVLTLPKSSEFRHELADSQGQTVLIVVVDSNKYMGGTLPKAEPDQRDLDLSIPAEGADEDNEEDNKMLPSPEQVELEKLKKEARALGVEVKSDWDADKIKSAIATYRANQDTDAA